MRGIAVLPFAVDGIELEAHDLAQWLAGETAWELCGPGTEARLVIDPVALSPEALGDAAAQLGVEAALGATFALAAERLTLHLLLADARGNVRAQWDELAPLGIGPHLGRRIARRVLHALGEDAAAPPESIEREAPGAVVLRLARAVRRLDVDDLLALATEFPALSAAPRALLHAAQRAIGEEKMPALFSALERLAQARPHDAEVLLALGDYRALHLDEAGARPLYLRAAIRLADDARAHARLGRLLLAKDPAQGILALTRATVLAPGDAALHLVLARALREHGSDPVRALAAASRAARLAEADPSLADEVRAELELLLS